MNAPKLAAVAALAALALPAAAHPCDDDRRPAPAPVVVVQPPPPAGAWVAANVSVRPEYRPDHRPDHRPGFRHTAWREHQRNELRAEYARLEADRNAFHARWAFHPRKLVRYDRWYMAQRAELDRRWQSLNMTAWR
ncbi:MAG: hypothetical protein QM767_27720 [Anaeromyxobacter sp.]